VSRGGGGVGWRGGEKPIAKRYQLSESREVKYFYYHRIPAYIRPRWIGGRKMGGVG